MKKYLRLFLFGIASFSAINSIGELSKLPVLGDIKRSEQLFTEDDPFAIELSIANSNQISKLWTTNDVIWVLLSKLCGYTNNTDYANVNKRLNHISEYAFDNRMLIELMEQHMTNYFDRSVQIITNQVDDRYVYREGNKTESIDGLKTFQNDVKVGSGSTIYNYGRIDLNRNPTDGIAGYIDFKNTGSSSSTWLNRLQSTLIDGKPYLMIRNTSIDNNNDYYIPADDNSSKIITSQWANNIGNSLIHKSGDELIKGQKSFHGNTIYFGNGNASQTNPYPSVVIGHAAPDIDSNGSIINSEHLEIDGNEMIWRKGNGRCSGTRGGYISNGPYYNSYYQLGSSIDKTTSGGALIAKDIRLFAVGDGDDNNGYYKANGSISILGDCIYISHTGDTIMQFKKIQDYKSNVITSTNTICLNNNYLALNKTPPQGDDSKKIATTEYVKKEISDNNVDLIPIGTIFPYVGSTAPANYLICNGQTFSETEYPKLYEILNANTVPNLVGRFLRGAKSDDNDNYGANDVGSYIEEGLPIPTKVNFSGTIKLPVNTMPSYSAGDRLSYGQNNSYNDYLKISPDDVSVSILEDEIYKQNSPVTPASYSVNYIIKAK